MYVEASEYALSFLERKGYIEIRRNEFALRGVLIEIDVAIVQYNFSFQLGMLGESCCQARNDMKTRERNCSAQTPG